MVSVIGIVLGILLLSPSMVWGQGIHFSALYTLNATDSSAVSSCAWNDGTGNLIFGGSAGGNASVAMFDDHNQLQVHTTGARTSSELEPRVTADSRGNAFLTGSFVKTATFETKDTRVSLNASGDNATAFVAKYAANGSVAWALATNGTDMSRGIDIASDRAGAVYAGGQFSGVHLMPRDRTSGVFDGFVIKIDSPSGAVDWNKTIGTDRTVDLVSSIAAGPGDRLYVAGLKGDSLFIQAWNATTGEQLQGFSEVNQEIGTKAYLPALMVAGNGRIYVTGAYQGPEDFNGIKLPVYGGADIFLAAYTDTGKQIFATSLGSAGDDAGYSLALTGDGLIMVAGEIGGQQQAGDAGLGSPDSSQALVAVWNSNGWMAGAASSHDATVSKAMDIVVHGNAAYLAGDFSGDMTLGGRVFQNPAARNGFLAIIDNIEDIGKPGQMELSDGIRILQYLAGDIPQIHLPFHPDVNNSGTVDIADALSVLRSLNGKMQ